MGIGMLLAALSYKLFSAGKREHNIEDLEFTLSYLAVGFSIVMIGIFI